MVFVESEKTAAAWFWRILMGYVNVIDGIVSILSLGFLSSGLAYRVTLRLLMARSRYIEMNKDH